MLPQSRINPSILIIPIFEHSLFVEHLSANLIQQHLPEKTAASDEASSRSAQYQQFQQHQQHQQQSEASSFQASSASSLPTSSSLSSGGVAPAGGAGGPGDHHLHGSLFGRRLTKSLCGNVLIFVEALFCNAAVV